MGHKYVKENETFNTSRNGTVPKPTGQEVTDNKFLRADGTWQSGGGGSTVSVDQVVTSGTEIGGVTIDGVRTALFAPKHKYSTTEQVVGKWIDGKPLYELTVNLGALSAATTNLIDCAIIAVIDTLVSATGSAYNSDYNQWVNLPHVHLDIALYGVAITILKSTNKIRAVVGTNWGFSKAFLTMRYTKTTDTV